MSVSTRLRFEILRRDNFACRYCGLKATENELQVDHVVPRALGGTDDPENLVTACIDCNAGKTSTAPDASMVTDISQRHLEWREALRQAASEVADRGVNMEDVERVDADWCRWGVAGQNGREVPRPDDWHVTVKVWLRRGLTVDMICHGINVAMGKKDLPLGDVWRYCCGVNWNQLSKVEERAKILLEQTLRSEGYEGTRDALEDFGHIGEDTA